MKKTHYTKWLFLTIFTCYSFVSFSQFLLYPESVLWDNTHKCYLVSNSLTGDIQKRNPDGSYSRFSDTTYRLLAPRGLTIFKGALWVAEAGGLKKIDLNSGKLLDSIAVVDTSIGVLNDVTSDGNNYFFASDIFRNKVYKINATTKVVDTIVKKGISGPNGLLYESAYNRLLIVTYTYNASVYAVDLTNDSLTKVKGTSYAGFDGIASDGKGNYFVSEWVDPNGTAVGNIYKFTGSIANNPVKLKSGFKGPADIFYNTLNDTIAIPEMIGNDVVFINALTDIIPPMVDTAYAISYTKVRVIYNEPVNSTATTNPITRYQGLGPLSSATINSHRDTVTLNLGTALVAYTPKTLSINGVQDMVGNTMAGGQSFMIVYPASGIDENFANQYNLKVYPNPVSENLKLEYTLSNSSSVSIHLFDVNGRAVYSSASRQSSGAHASVINTAQYGIENGMYIIDISIDGHSGHGLIMVTR